MATNVALWSGNLRPTRNGLFVNAPAKDGTIQTIYQLGALWLHWTQDVDVVPAPIQTDDNRVYYSGHYNPKITNETIANASGDEYPTDYYRLGVVSPDTAPTVGHTGGSGSPETRSYVYTYVTQWGEEGPPSPAGTHAGVDDATQWDLSGMDTAPPNSVSVSNAVSASGTTTVTTASGHFLETGEYVVIDSVTGMTDLNGTWQVTRTGTTTFTIELNTAQSYSSGGTVTREAPQNVSSMTKRIYRTSAGKYYYVDEIAAATTTYTDTTATTALGSQIESDDWYSPLKDLRGLITASWGSLVGFQGKIVAFSEPYVPYAWPTAYQFTFDYDVVALAALGDAVVVLTTGTPYIILGTHPALASVSQIDLLHSCLSKRSVAKFANGVAYSGPDGLTWVGLNGVAEIITQKLLTKTDWEKFAPSSIVGIEYQERYYGFYRGGGDDGNTAAGFVFSPQDPTTIWTDLAQTATAAFLKQSDGTIYLMDPNEASIVKWEAGGGYYFYEWRSKIITSDRPLTFRAAKVRNSFGEGISASAYQDALDAAVDDVDTKKASYQESHSGALGGFPPGRYTVAGGPYTDAVNKIGGPITSTSQPGATLALTFRLYADGTLKYEKTLDNSRAFRLPAGYRSDQWEIEISAGNVEVSEIILAETMSELAAV